MNERIKKLHDQAFAETTDYYATIQRFSELIVKECGDIAYKAYWDNPDSVRGIHIKEQINKHFGVK